MKRAAALALSVCAAACGASVREPLAVTIGPGAPGDTAYAMVDRASPGDMVLIPGGPFEQGCTPSDALCFSNEQPRRTVVLDAFYLDRTEVSVAAYARCAAAGACPSDDLGTATAQHTTWNAPDAGLNRTKFGLSAPSAACNWGKPGRERHPINCVTWNEATAYCAWAAKRLPTEAEWEKAARGATTRIYPWGDGAPSCAHATMGEPTPGCGAGTTSEVGARQGDVSPFGVRDMGGNVTEWTADWYDEHYYATAPTTNPRGALSGRLRVVRGGTFQGLVRDKVDAFRSSNRYSYVPTARLTYVGFRCARDAGRQ